MPRKPTVKKSIKKKIIKANKEIEPQKIMNDLILSGDISKMSNEDRLKYYFALCKSVNLNPLTKPFDIIILQGKTMMYANKNCAEQLRRNNAISIIAQDTKLDNGVCITTVRVQDKTGRTDTGMGVVPIVGLNPDALSNAIMKSETKAKRRATLSIAGLGMLDESELDTIPQFQTLSFNMNSGNMQNNQSETFESAQNNTSKYPIACPLCKESAVYKDKHSDGHYCWNKRGGCGTNFDKDMNVIDKQEEAKKKLEELPDNIKKGFEILSYNDKQKWNLCSLCQWNNAEIISKINELVEN